MENGRGGGGRLGPLPPPMEEGSQKRVEGGKRGEEIPSVWTTPMISLLSDGEGKGGSFFTIICSVTFFVTHLSPTKF